MYASFAKGQPLLTGDINPEWSSESQNYRQKIRKAASVSRFFSVSHCHSMGGFVGLTDLHPKSLQIGFDLEEIARVSEGVAKRVSNPRDQDPGAEHTPALLWTAREAAFKALIGPEQPQVISQIRLGPWQNPQENIWTFTFQSSGCAPGEGFAWEADELQCALCFWSRESQNETGFF